FHKRCTTRKQVLTQLFRQEKLLLANAGKDTVFVKAGLEQTIVFGPIWYGSRNQHRFTPKNHSFGMRETRLQGSSIFTVGIYGSATIHVAFPLRKATLRKALPYTVAVKMLYYHLHAHRPPWRPMARQKQQKMHGEKPASLKTLAEHLGLSPATISVVLNDVPGRSIPQATRDRIKAASKKLNYQPSLLARSLRNRRTHTIGILVPELGEGYHTQVLSGVGDQLVQEGYFYFTAHHRHNPE